MAEQGPTVADRTPIFAVLAANAVSQMGDYMVAVAMLWFVLETTGSAAKTGLTGAAIGVGAIVSSVLGGPLVDRLGYRRASVVGHLHTRQPAPGRQREHIDARRHIQGEPSLLIVAAIFGLTPDLIIRRLTQQVDKYKEDLQSSQSADDAPANEGAQRRQTRRQAG